MDQPPMVLAADLRKRFSNGRYWLARGAGVLLLFGGNFLYVFCAERWVPEGKFYDAVAVGLICLVWALVDNEIMYRHGRKKRWKEVEAEILAREAEREADQARP